jgi:hypothetical protein
LLEAVTLETPVSLVKDVSIEVERVLEVLQELKWQALKKVWGKLSCVPYVRCRWGCSENYHKTNDLPYDHFVKSILDYTYMKVYSTKSQGQWTRGMRHDFVFIESRILHNPAWLCMPSIVIVAGKIP